MGLELVELLMDTEREFGLEISDLEAERLATVGDLYSFVLTRKGLSAASLPVIPRAFCALRRGLGKAFDAPRTSVHPRREILSLVSGQVPATVLWPRLQGALGLEMPPLEKDWPWSQSLKIPKSGRTVGDLTRSVASLNLPELLGPSDARSEIWSRLCDVIIRCIGVKRAELLLHHHFIHDLDCG